VPSSVRAVLNRPLYCGEIVWNQTRKRNSWGQKQQAGRPESDWLHVEARDLRIVSDELWQAAQAQATERRAKYKGGDRSFRTSPYLLSGFARCAVCGGGFASHSRTHGKHLARFYGCTSYWERGANVCGNRLVGRMEAIDAEVLATLKDDILRPTVVERAVSLALAELNPERERTEQAHVSAELAEIDAECRKLTGGITAGGQLEALVSYVDRLRILQERRKVLAARGSSRRPIVPPAGAARLETSIREKLNDWRGLLTRDVAGGREVLRTLLVGPLRFTPVVEPDRRGYRFNGAIALDRVIGGVVTLDNTRSSGVPDGIRQVLHRGNP
jgi:hypothetical protein